MIERFYHRSECLLVCELGVIESRRQIIYIQRAIQLYCPPATGDRISRPLLRNAERYAITDLHDRVVLLRRN